MSQYIEAKDYKIVTESYPELKQALKLAEEAVNNYINDGYSVYGELHIDTIRRSSQDIWEVTQVMIK